jgi:hypothetical protein
MRTNLAVSIFRGAIASACLASSLLAQVSSNSSTTPAFDPAFVVQPPTYGSTCLVGFLGDTTIAGGWTAFEAASCRTMEVISSGLPGFSQVTTIPSSFGNVTLTPAHMNLFIGSGWATWSHGYSGEVFWTQGATSATVTMPAGVGAFDCYLEPNPFSINSFTVTGTASDASTVGITVTADGASGASHFGFYTTNGCCLTSVTITGAVDWAIGELRVGDCNDCGLGTSYCTVNPNSTGLPALMGAAGSNDISVNNFTATASQLPPGQFYIFFHGPNQQDIAFGNGRLCVGAPQTRLNPPQLSTAGGLASRVVDVSGFAPGVQNFQCWFRDPPAGGAFFNTSDGLSVTFVP